MFQIDPLSKTPIYEQIIEQLEKYVISGILKPGDAVPSVRSLSMEIKTNPNTIQKAYSELDSRGIIRSVPGKGCFVCAEATDVLRERARGKLSDLTDLCERLKLAGVGENEMIEAVKRVFDDKTRERNEL